MEYQSITKRDELMYRSNADASQKHYAEREAKYKRINTR